MKAVILAGGKGTRLAPYTTILPKPLMPVGDLPILEIVICQLRSAGITEITLSVGYLGSLLEAYFGDGSRWGVAISYSREDHPLGTAGPLALVSQLTNTFLVMNGDILTTLDYAALARFHREHEALATVALFKKPVKIDLGIIKRNGENCVIDYIEKPTLEYEVSTGIYVMELGVLDFITSGEQLDLPDLIKRLIEKQQKVLGYNFEGQWLDIGRPEDHARAVEQFVSGRSSFLRA
jgi:NDP-sugar pyrophosphorylase family protein